MFKTSQTIQTAWTKFQKLSPNNQTLTRWINLVGSNSNEYSNYLKDDLSPNLALLLAIHKRVIDVVIMNIESLATERGEGFYGNRYLQEAFLRIHAKTFYQVDKVMFKPGEIDKDATKFQEVLNIEIRNRYEED